MSELEMPLEKISGDWRAKSLCFWPMFGFVQLDDAEGRIVFQAGSKIKSMYSFKAQSIARVVRIFIRDGKLVFQYIPDLSTRGGFNNASDPDIPYLNWEIEEFGAYLEMPPHEAETYAPEMPNTVFLGLRSAGSSLMKILLPIFVLACVVFVFSKSQNSANSRNEMHIEKRVMENREGIPDVYLMPFFGFDEAFAGGLARELSKDLNLNVKVTTSIPPPKGAFNPNREQYSGPDLVSALYLASRRLYDTRDKTVYIGLLNGSLYDPNMSFRFVFTIRAANRHAVVGNYEMNAGVSEGLYNMRIYKIIKRNIGAMYYGYAPSNDIKSLMYSPIMSTVNLDDVGTAFEGE